jgi:hypothetical protein
MKVNINGHTVGVAGNVRRDGNKLSIEYLLLYKNLMHEIPDLKERADFHLVGVGDLDFHSGDVDVGRESHIYFENTHWFIKGEPDTERDFPPMPKHMEQNGDIITLRC